MALFTGVTTFMYLQYSRPLIYHLLSNVWKASYTISLSIFGDAPYWLPYIMVKFIFCVVPGSFTWRRDHNSKDSFQVSTVDVPESPIASGARGPWQQQQRCDSLHCYEEWWGSVPTSVIIFSWVLHEDGRIAILLQMKNTVFLFKSFTTIYFSFQLYVLQRSLADQTMPIVCLR